MRFRAHLLFKVLVIASLCWSCSYTKFKSKAPSENAPPLTKIEIDSLSFSRIFQTVIDPYCLSCHRTGKYPLSSYVETKSVQGKIRQSVFIDSSMPKDKVLPSKEKNLLLAWLDAGAPEFGKTPSPDPDIPKLEPTFSSIRDRIFNVRCGSCHNPTSDECRTVKTFPFKRIHGDEHAPNQSKGSCNIELSNYNELLNGEEETRKELVLPGNADESQLVISIERTDGKDQMPPPEEGYSPLSTEEIKTIRDWINAGALNN